MSTVEVSGRFRVDVSVFMTVFHTVFLVVSLIGLFLITVRVISFDFDASVAVVAAVLLNLVFAFLWAAQIEKKAAKKQASSHPSLVVTAKAIRGLSKSISFVVVVHNDEDLVARCIDGVFNVAAECRAPSEVLVVDDGSGDGTFERAWAAVGSRRAEFVRVSVRVVKHLSHLGVVESVRTVVNRVVGEYVALIDARAACDPAQLSGVVSRVCPVPKVAGDVQVNCGLYAAEALRQLLN